MNKINPKLSQIVLEEIKNQSNDIVDLDGVKIKACKNVFPSKSDNSHTSEKLHTIFGDLRGLNVLDVGTGTGVQAIWAAKKGANNVVALDINPAAVICAKENVKLNKVEKKVIVIESDLFEKIEKDIKFDVVIANLPITDYPLSGIVESALYDPDYNIHRRFLSEVGNHIKQNSIIIMTHINFKGKYDFEEFEKMLLEYGYILESFVETEHVGFLWRMYRIKRINNQIN